MMSPAVIPVLVGPLQAVMAVLPALLAALAGALLALFKPSSIKKLALLLWSQKLVVVPVAAAIFLLVHYWAALFPTVGSAGAREGADDAWLLWRGGVGRRAVVASETPEPAQGQVQWRYDADPMVSCFASPAVVGNRLYVTGSHFMPPLGIDRGAIYALDADTGELVWRYGAEGYRSTFSSPAVFGDTLVVGEGLHETRDARIYCIDLAASEAAGRGVKLWSLRTASHVESSPCIYDGKAYIGAGDDGFYCLDLAGDGDGEAKIIWQAKGDDYLDCEPSAAAFDGRVYFGLGKGGKAVVCLDAATGDRVWRVPTPYPAFGSPAIADGKVVVGMGIGNYILSAEQIADGVRKEMLKNKADDEAIREATKDIFPAGEVWCLDARTGDVLWKFTDVERTVLGSPAIADGRVYFASRDHKLYCVRLADGERISTFDAYAPMVGAPAVGDEYVYVVTQTGRLYGVERRTLRPVWAVNLNATTVSSPVVARGHVYVGADEGGLVCVGEPGRVVKPPLWAGPGGGAGQSGWCDGSAAPVKAGSAWRYTPGGDGAVTSAAACVGEAMYVGVVEGRAATGVVRLDIASDGPSLDKPRRLWFVPTPNRVSICPVVVGDRVAFVDGRAGNEGRRRMLRCVNAATGDRLWASPVEADASGVLAATDRYLFIADGARCVSAFSVSGERIWRLDDHRLIGQPLAMGDLLFMAVESGDASRLIALDAPTASVLWEAAADDSRARPVTGPVLAADKLWVGTAAGLAAYNPIDGERVGRLPGGRVARRLLSDQTRIVVGADDGLLMVDAAAGEPIGEPIAGAAVPPVLAGDAMVYSDGEALRRLDVATGDSVLLAKLYPKYYGPIVGELLVTRSHVLVATEKRGLICLRPKGN